jgi:hypothetical protein
MLLSFRFTIILLTVISIASGQNERKLTARELFYTPVSEVKSPAAAPKTTVPKQASATPKPQSKTTPQQSAKSQPEPASVQREEPPSYVQRVSTGSEIVGPPLALRYSLLKQNSGGEYIEVSPDTMFRSGDKIRVSIEANDASYLYIVQQGSSKAWNVLFPNGEIDDGSNHVERNRRYTIPAGGRFVFDEQAGTERIFIVLSRRPEPDLEKMIYDLSGKSGAPATPSPAAVPPADRKPKMMLAQNRIDDSLVSRLRSQMVARDLVFEKVDDDKPAPSGTKEKAMYYGTQDRTARARIIVDLNLRHQ